MKISNLGTGGGCPYWQESSLECKVTKGGLYLPMPAHVETFCRNENFIQCHQYVRGGARPGFSLADDQMSRRRHHRMPARLALRLLDPEASDQEAVLCEDARAVDLSLGGLRLESGMNFPVNRKLRLVFGDDFAVPSWVGEGEVRWSREASSEIPCFYAGIAFTDSHTQEAVSRHLGLPL